MMGSEFFLGVEERELSIRKATVILGSGSCRDQRLVRIEKCHLHLMAVDDVLQYVILVLTWQMRPFLRSVCVCVCVYLTFFSCSTESLVFRR